MRRELTSARHGLEARRMSEQTDPPAAPGADVPPDRLAVNPRSQHFDADLLQRITAESLFGVRHVDGFSDH